MLTSKRNQLRTLQILLVTNVTVTITRSCKPIMNTAMTTVRWRILRLKIALEGDCWLPKVQIKFCFSNTKITLFRLKTLSRYLMLVRCSLLFFLKKIHWEVQMICSLIVKLMTMIHMIWEKVLTHQLQWKINALTFLNRLR